MKRLRLQMLLSVIANLLLTATLINIYLTDPPNGSFTTWVNQQISSPYAAPLFLAISVASGSSAGYFLLRRKHPGLSLAERLQRAKSMKQAAPLARSTSTSLGRSIPVGAPPGPVSKHTAYAVPPLSRTPAQLPQRQGSPSSWSTTPKQWSPGSFQGQRQEQKTEGSTLPESAYSHPSPPTSPESSPEQLSPQRFPRAVRPEASGQLSRTEPTAQSLPAFPSPIQDPRQPPFPSRPLERAEKPFLTPRWEQKPSNETSGTDKTLNPYPKPQTDNLPRPASTFLGQLPGQTSDKTPRPPTIYQPSKLQPSDPSSQPHLWADPVPKPKYSTPQRWFPPSVSPVPSPRSQTPTGLPSRPGQASENRPQFPGPQGLPRPLTSSGSLRPGPSEVPGTFRPDQRRPLGMGGLQRPLMTNPRPTPPSTSPQTEVRKEPSSPSLETPQSQPPSQTQHQGQPLEIPPPSPSAGESLVGEMDWDTALDAILKTLRKDKVGDKS